MRLVRPRTTAQRLIVTLTAAVAVVLVATSVVSIVVVNRYIQDRTDSRLLDTSQRIRAYLETSTGFDIDTATVDNMSRAGAAVTVALKDGSPVLWVNGDEQTARLAAASALPDGEPHPVRDRADLMAIRFATPALRLTGPAGAVTPSEMVVAMSTARETAATRTLTWISVAGTLLTLALLVGLTVLIVGRGLRPLQAMAERAEAYARGDRSVRLPDTLGEPDVTRLAGTLNQALDAQQEAEGRLRAFIADASHELRTPLTIATGWIELDAQGGLADQERREHAMTRVQVQLGRMRVLIDELALLARLDRERPLTLETVDLTALTAEVIEDARLTNPDRTFTVHASGPAALRADVPRLQQVLGNLVGNAVQHTPAGTPVEVTVTPAAAGGPATRPMHTLLVTDHGPGIPEPDQRRVFERFWRGDASRRRQTGGSGLGLAIVASIVAAHGGSSDVLSRPGEGTTVRVRLPLAAEPPAPSR